MFKRRRNLSIGSIIIGVILLLVLSACSQETVNEENETNDNETNENGAVAGITDNNDEEESLPYSAPLTGEGSEQQLDHRAIAVPIDNYEQARPQVGVNKADIVYEILAEGSVSRLISVYHSQMPDRVGPIRSLRPYYMDVVAGFDPAFAHAGGSPAAKEKISMEQVASIDDTANGGIAFYRDETRNAPHNLFSGKEQLQEAMEFLQINNELGEIPEVLFKDEDDDPHGEESEQVNIVYDDVYLDILWKYNAQSGKYERNIQGVPHVDSQTEEPLSFTNVLIIETWHQVLDDQGRRDIDVQGEGDGYLLQQGHVQEVEWNYAEGMIRVYEAGDELGLYPGSTWVNIVPTDPGLEAMVDFESSEPETSQ